MAPLETFLKSNEKPVRGIRRTRYPKAEMKKIIREDGLLPYANRIISINGGPNESKRHPINKGNPIKNK